MPLIPYSTFVSRVLQQVFPDTDGSLEPVNLVFPHRTHIQNALIQAQTYVECLRQNNVNTYSLNDALVNCGVAIIEGPEHIRVGAVYAFKPEKGCTRQHYTQQSVNAIMCYVDGFACGKCSTENDICNAVRSGNQVCDNLALCDDWDAEVGEPDTNWKCEEKIFAMGAGSRIYLAPRFPCGYRLAVHWEGVKYRYADTDLISDDPDLLDVVSTYVQAERAKFPDRDIAMWKELLGNGPAKAGKGGSAWHTKIAAMAHRCREERRIRTRPCLEMWDDSAMSSENIGAQLDPVPARPEADVVFERCDGCPEGKIMVDGECIDCLTPVVSLSASDTTLVTGQAVTITFSSSNVLDHEMSRVTLEYDGHEIELTPNEAGNLAFTPTADTTYTIRASTVCGDDVLDTVSVTVSDEIDDCPCPAGMPECLSITGFDANTFTDRVRFAYIADYGNPANSPNPEEVEAQVQAFSPDYVITGGDNKYGVNMDTVFELLPYYRSMRDAERMFTTAQNHDTTDGGGIDDYLDAFPYLPGDQRNYSIRVGPVEIFFRETHSTGVAPPDLAASAAWLAAATAASSARWKVVVTGDAPYTSVDGSDYPGHDHSRLDYASMGVQLVLSGDSHHYERFLVDGVNYIVAGNGGTNLVDFWGSEVEGSLVRIKDYGFLGVEADGEQLVVQYIDDDGVVRDTLTLESEDGQIECVTGNDSVAAAWDGTLERVDNECMWGFALNIHSYRDQNVGAFVLLDHCEDDGTPVFRMQVLAKTEDASEILWSGTARNQPIGTYERDPALTCGPLSIGVSGCDCDAEDIPTLEFDPPNGSMVSFPSVAFIRASDETALIYYTTDGSEPDNNSALYTDAVSLVAGDVLKARAYTTNCVGEVHEAEYIVAEGFAFDFVCDTVDKAGVFEVFAPNGSDDYHWTLVWSMPAERTVKRLEIYETNTQGVWVTGQAWATNSPIYPEEMDGDPFSVYPLVIIEGETQLNTAYAATIGTYASNIRTWQLYGQPFIPLTGYFKLLFVLDDGAGGEDIVYKLISHDCYYSYYYEEEPLL